MKRKLKIDYDGRWYRVYEWVVTGYSWFFWDGRWSVLNLYSSYEEAHEAVTEALKFPKYFESEE